MSIINTAEFQFDNNRYALDSLTVLNNIEKKYTDKQDFSELLKSNLHIDTEIKSSAETKTFIRSGGLIPRPLGRLELATPTKNGSKPPQLNNFLTERASSIRQRLQDTPPLAAERLIDKKDKLYEQCEALETFLLKTLINGMRKTVEKSEFNKGGFAGEMYEDMLYDEYAKDFTRNAGFGLAELAYLELSGRRGKLMNRQGITD
jgi:flagellar protein FlgJ